jgi:hypothetical protein
MNAKWMFSGIVSLVAGVACSSNDGEGANCVARENIDWDGCAPAGSTRLGDVAPDETISVLFVLNRDDEGLDALLAEQSATRQAGGVADWATVEELRAWFGAPDSDIEQVLQYLDANGIDGDVDPPTTTSPRP